MHIELHVYTRVYDCISLTIEICCFAVIYLVKMVNKYFRVKNKSGQKAISWQQDFHSYSARVSRPPQVYKVSLNNQTPRHRKDRTLHALLGADMEKRKYVTNTRLAVTRSCQCLAFAGSKILVNYRSHQNQP